MSTDLDPKPHPEILHVALVSLVTILMSCCNASCMAGGVTGRCLRWLHPCEAKCASSLSASAVMRQGRWLFWLVLIWICPGSRRAVEAVFDLGSTWIFTQREENWQAGGRVGGNWGAKQGELSLDMCVDATAGWKEASDTHMVLSRAWLTAW